MSEFGNFVITFIVYSLYFECDLGGRLGRDRMVLDLQLPMQSIDIATDVVSSYPIQARYTRYHITHLCIYKYYVFPSPKHIPHNRFGSLFSTARHSM